MATLFIFAKFLLNVLFYFDFGIYCLVWLSFECVRRIYIEGTYIYGDRRRSEKLFCREKIEGAGLPDGNIGIEK